MREWRGRKKVLYPRSLFHSFSGEEVKVIRRKEQQKRRSLCWSWKRRKWRTWRVNIKHEKIERSREEEKSSWLCLFWKSFTLPFMQPFCIERDVSASGIVKGNRTEWKRITLYTSEHRVWIMWETETRNWKEEEESGVHFHEDFAGKCTEPCHVMCSSI